MNFGGKMDAQNCTLGSGTGLQKVLTPIHLWAISVGLVISGEYFGWSYGWGVAGTIGFLLTTALVAVMYLTFIFSFTELTTAIPNAGGPFAYANAALGPWGGILAGYATLIEFLFASPAIAFALGSYLHFVFPQISQIQAAVAVFFLFSAVNVFGVKHAARFELAVTLIAVLELLVFIALVAPSFRMVNFVKDAYPKDILSVFTAIPYAIWFFLAIEGVAMAAEEVKRPERDIPIGYLSGILTLVVLAFSVMFAAGGVGDWKTLSQMDYPVPEALAMALGRENQWVKVLAGIGLFGLVASLNGIIFSSSRQIFALARAGLLPGVLARVNSHQAPHSAVFFSFGVGVISLISGRTDELITLSAMGAVLMYGISMVSLFVLRKNRSDLIRPYRVPFYPAFPAVALVLSTVCLGAMIYTHAVLAGIFVLLLLVGIFREMSKKASAPCITGGTGDTVGGA